LLPKWVASVWSARPLGFFIGLVWAFGFVTGGLHAAALPLLLAAALIYAAFFATLGLWMSMAYHSTMRATLFAVLAAAVLIPGPGLFGKIFFDPPALSGPPPVWDERLVSQMLSPALTMWTLTFDAGNLFGKDVGLPMLDLAAAVIGLHFYLLVTMILWASLLARFEAEKGPAANNAECKMQHAE
jgi:hypothetical protein